MRQNGSEKCMIKKNIKCVLGHQDIPIIQEQPEFAVDLLQTNILLFGLSMSGKTNFLKLIINILHKQYRETDEQIFILDFGGALAEYETLPLVSAYFDNANEEYVKRVFKLMEDQLKHNISKLKGKNYCSCEDFQPIHTTLIIDNVNAFLDEPRYQAYQESLAKICRDGLSKGITVIMTASATKGLNSYMNSFKQKIALELPTESYMDIFNHKVIPVGSNPGHGYANVTIIPEDLTATFPIQNAYELQLNYADDIKEQTFKNNLTKHFDNCTVKKYKRFPEILNESKLEEFLKCDNAESFDKTKLLSNNSVIIGLDYTECKPYSVDYDNEKVIAIYGKKEFGKTNLLTRLLKNMLADEKYKFVFFDDGREQLKENLADTIKSDTRKEYIQGYEKQNLPQKDGEIQNVSLSPMQIFLKYIHDNYMDLSTIRRAGNLILNEIFGTKFKWDYDRTENYNNNSNTVFVLQSKFLYVNTMASKIFMEIILPSLAVQAEEKNWIFIFTDVKNISDSDTRDNFNSTIETAFLLDNIAEFVSERGQKSVFCNMDVKSLKEEYARCELGDGYVYSIEKDLLSKLKFVKNGEMFEDE